MHVTAPHRGRVDDPWVKYKRLPVRPPTSSSGPGLLLTRAILRRFRRAAPALCPLCGSHAGSDIAVDREADGPRVRHRGYQEVCQLKESAVDTCTPAADLVIRRYLEEGSKIAREITARYSN